MSDLETLEPVQTPIAEPVTPEPIEGQPTPEPQKEEEPKPDGKDRRINKLTAQKYQYKAEAEQAKKDAEYWRQRAEGNQRSGEPAKPTRDSFQSDEEYIESLTEWKIGEHVRKQNESKRTKEPEDRMVKVAETFTAKEAEYSEEHEDYQEAVEDLQADLRGRGLGFSPTALEFIGEAGPALLHHLAQNLKEARRIAALSPTRQTAELGKLEDKVSPPKSLAQKQKSAAPEPISPVRPNASGDVEPKNVNDWMKWREKQLKS